MCYFNPLETNPTELVKNHHGKEVEEKKWISEEARNSPVTGTGKGILRKQSADSSSSTKVLHSLALPNEVVFLVSNRKYPYLDWII